MSRFGGAMEAEQGGDWDNNECAVQEQIYRDSDIIKCVYNGGV